MSDLGNKKIMAQNILYYMNKKDVDRNAVCDELNIKYTTFSDWVNAKTYPRIDKIELLAQYFGVRKSFLVEGFLDYLPTTDRKKYLSLEARLEMLTANPTGDAFSEAESLDVYEEMKALEEYGRKLMRLSKENTSDSPTTIAAHFDGEEYTEEELDKIKEFAEFVKNQRK
jgi:transcriptional regulator with XRE-family HTH domain